MTQKYEEKSEADAIADANAKLQVPVYKESSESNFSIGSFSFCWEFKWPTQVFVC